MNSRILLFILLLSSLISSMTLLLSSCTHQQDIKYSPVSGKLTNNSECKSLRSVDIQSDGWDTSYCIQYTYNDSSKILYMKHINAMFSCCPDSIFCEVYSSNDTITIFENEKEDMCSCICQYDLDIELTGVERFQYVVKLIVPADYATGENPLFFEIDLVSTYEGEYCW